MAEATRVIDGIEIPAPGVWDVDAAHSRLGAVARHLMVTKVRGSFGVFGGTIVVGERPEDSRVEVDVDAASIDVCAITGNLVTFIGEGTCTISAGQAGGHGFVAAPTASQTLLVARTPQAVSFLSTPPASAVAALARFDAAGGARDNVLALRERSDAIFTDALAAITDPAVAPAVAIEKSRAAFRLDLPAMVRRSLALGRWIRRTSRAIGTLLSLIITWISTSDTL